MRLSNKFTSSLKVVLATILVTAPVAAMACGESLFRVGKGVNYRAYVAPIPGNILVVTAEDDGRLLAEALISAGHQVRVVADATELGAAVKSGGYDIVLARFGEREMVEAQVAASTVAYLPVAMENSPEEDLAREMYKRSLSTDDNIKRFLRTIHKTLVNA
jgi:hypothetical protein